MQEEQINKKLSKSNDEIDLKELFYVLLEGRWIIISVTSFISIVGLIYSLLLPNIYESRALIYSMNSTDSISGALRGYSGLASIAGINIPSNDNMGNHSKAIKKINSLSFFENNILKNIYLPDLMAVKSWNSETNTLTYDSSTFDNARNTWVNPGNKIPSPQASYIKFISNHLSLYEDKMTGFITLSIKHQSPFIAKQWAELVIDEINNFFRLKDKLESEIAVSYLNNQIAETGLSEVKELLAQLMQKEIEKLKLVEANQFYVFGYIDPPAVMEKKSEPKRALICILSALFGGMLSLAIVLIRYFAFSKKGS